MLDTYGFYMGNAQILVGCRFFLATVKGTARDTWLGVIDDNLPPPRTKRRRSTSKRFGKFLGTNPRQDGGRRTNQLFENDQEAKEHAGQRLDKTNENYKQSPTFHGRRCGKAL